jgi:hyperosmotically inducible periplasmic protein
MRELISCVKAMAVGAVAMYYLDPDLGRRRRAELNDKLRSTCDSINRCVRTEGRQVARSVRGLAAEVESSVTASVVDDNTQVECIRAALAGLVSKPDAIDVSVNDGIATLAGRVAASEHAGLIAAVDALPGVRSVADLLDVYEEPGGVPTLQGGSPS